jgi:predicted acetyltransferase
MPHSSPFTIRPLTEADRDSFINLGRLAFTPLTGLSESQTDRPIHLESRPGWVAVDADHRLVGRYRQLDLATFWQGARLPVAGVGGVAVAIERRGQKVAQVMLDHALHTFRDRQFPLSMLYPFQHGFYRKLGWAWVNAPHQYRVATRHLPFYPERVHMAAVSAANHAALQAVYDQAAPTHNGWLDRQPWHWEAFFELEGGSEIYQYVDAGKCQGYVAIEFKRLAAAQSTMTVIVNEWVALTAAAYRGILGFLASLRDQVETIVWNTYASDPFPHLLHEQHTNPILHPERFEFGFVDPFGAIGGGFMWRLVDVVQALEARPIQQTEPFCIGFQITDPVFGEQRVDVEMSDRAMRCIPKTSSTTIHLSIAQLTALFCSVRTAHEMHWLGEIEVDGNSGLLGQLDAAWQTTPPFCWDFF